MGLANSVECLIIWDAGATNTTVSLLRTDGGILSSASRPTTVARAADGLSWPLDRMWRNFCELTKELLLAHNVQPKAVNLTTFGVCWGAIGKGGNLLYPVISWKCPRTREQLRWAQEHLDMDDAYVRTGAPPFYFNTAFSLRWMRDHRPEVLERAETFLLMPQLFVERLCGARVSERSMATTTMLFDLAEGDWSAKLFADFDIPNKFPREVGSPGDVAGKVTRRAAEATGIPAGTPVCSGGHDTVLAGVGACRDLRRNILYSTGTWSILVRTSDTCDIRVENRAHNILWQLNPHTEGVLGGYNTQGHMIGGLAFDVVRKKFLPNRSAADATELAARAPIGSGGVSIIPTFVANSGPNPTVPSAILGWEDATNPANAVRAVLEGLAYQTRDALSYLGDTAETILIGGGFAKNRLFGQILADVTGKPVELAGIPEVTTLGTAVLALVGTGMVSDPESAWRQIGMTAIRFEPENRDAYEAEYVRYRRLVAALDGAGLNA